MNPLECLNKPKKNNNEGRDRDVSSTLEGWWVALRPHTYPASVSPVIVGSSLAAAEGYFHLPAAVNALLVAVLIQTGVNLANDYFDYRKGVDAEQIGFPRACASGLLPPYQVKRAMIGSLLAVLIPGLYLVSWGGFPLLIAGILCLLATLFYSGGPVPYGSIALGDLMVFLFFGVVATTGTFYVLGCAHLGKTFPWWPPESTLPVVSLLVAIPPGAISTAILAINNYRDRHRDEAAGKITLAVLLGDTGSRVELSFLLSLAYLTPPVLWWWFNFSVPVLLPLLTLPLGWMVLRDVFFLKDRESLNDTLSRTGRLLLLFSLLFAGGLLV